MPDEARAVVTAIHGDRLEALYLLVLATGLREGEALAVSSDDVDVAAGVLHVRQNLVRIDGTYRLEALKTDKSRRDLPLPASVVNALRARLDTQDFEQ